jgi:hypothetical protein
LLAAVVVGGVTWSRLDDSTYDVDLPGTTSPRPLPALAAETLTDLTTALTDGDASAAAALAAPDDQASATWLRQVADNARSLGLTVTMRYVDEAGAVDALGGWAAEVDTTWRFAGDTGTEPARAEVVVRFRAVDDGVTITGFGRPQGDLAGGRLPLWLSGPVVVSSRPGIVVVTAGEGAEARSAAQRYLRLSATAVSVVRRVLPQWRGRLVVEVPASAAQLDEAMDVEPGSTSGIAAVTAPADGSPDTDSPVHVFVNPDVFDRLRPTGAQVVLSHEVAHVATGAARSAAEPWLVEGFADYVALRDVSLPVTTSAAQIIAQFRSDGPPSALPGRADFATDSGHLGATYESAWLACVLLAERGGEQALVRAYSEVADGTSLEHALRRHFGLDIAELTSLWRARLRDLAG